MASDSILAASEVVEIVGFAGVVVVIPGAVVEKLVAVVEKLVAVVGKPEVFDRKP